MSLRLGDFWDQESLSIENKAIHMGLRVIETLHDDDIFDIVMNGKWTSQFQTINENNVLEYIGLVLPKYIACYANANIDGEIRFGVDDSCEITGIPYIGKIPKKKILSIIKKTIVDNISGEIDSDEILKLIEVEYINLEIDESILSPDSDEYFINFSKEIRKYNDEIDEYDVQKALFLIEHRKYTQKLEKMLNTSKYIEELRQYIQSQTNSCDELVSQLNSLSYIKLKDENIYHDRDNQKRIFYWIAKFRDEKSLEISKTKPIKPPYPSLYHPKQILGNLPCMRLKFIKNNPKIKYYLIKIKCNVGGLEVPIGYRDRYNTDRWLYRKRIENSEIKLSNSIDTQSGPGCAKILNL